MVNKSKYDKEEHELKVKKYAEELLRTSHFPFSTKNMSKSLFALYEEFASIDKIEKGKYAKHLQYLYKIAEGTCTRANEKDPLFYRALSISSIYENPVDYARFAGESLNKATAELINDLMNTVWNSEGKLRSKDAKHAANVRHDKPGGSREKAATIRQIWATGKYSSRDICAEQECARLNMSYSAARKALRNTPNPS